MEKLAKMLKKDRVNDKQQFSTLVIKKINKLDIQKTRGVSIDPKNTGTRNETISKNSVNNVKNSQRVSLEEQSSMENSKLGGR